MASGFQLGKSPGILRGYIYPLVIDVNPGLINPVYGCLIGRVPLKKYQMK